MSPRASQVVRCAWPLLRSLFFVERVLANGGVDLLRSSVERFCPPRSAFEPVAFVESSALGPNANGGALDAFFFIRVAADRGRAEVPEACR